MVPATGSAMPHILEMHRQPPRADEDDVDPDILRTLSIARQQRLGGGDDAPEAVIVNRGREPGGIAAGLNFYEGDRPSAPRDQVDFATPRPHPFADDPPSVQPKPPGGNAFTDPALLLGGGAAVQSSSFNFIARA